MILTNFNRVLQYISFTQPNAVASVRGSQKYPDLFGYVEFYQYQAGVYVLCIIGGLPVGQEACNPGFFAIHLHDGGSCTPTEEEPFADAGGHYNPQECPHPAHAGDFPPLLASGQKDAASLFFTDRFRVEEIMGKTVVIHRGPDDFMTQPGGNAGERIGCGVIASRHGTSQFQAGF